MNKIQLIRRILSYTGANKILISFVCFVFIDALLIYVFDPAIVTYGDALWYCYAVISTAGFGDIVATTVISKILSVVLTVYAVVVIAIITGVIVNFYTRLIDMKLEKDKSEIKMTKDRKLMKDEIDEEK